MRQLPEARQKHGSLKAFKLPCPCSTHEGRCHMRAEWSDRADDKEDQPERELIRAAHLNAHALGAGSILQHPFQASSVVRDRRGGEFFFPQGAPKA